MDAAKVAQISQDTGIPEAAVGATVALFEKGYTVPFIARYRKHATNGLNEGQVVAVHEQFMQHREFLERRESLLKFLAEQGKLSDILRERIITISDRFDVEDLFLLYRPRRKSRAAEAIEKGLEQLAEYIWNQDPDAWSVEEHADVFVDPAKDIVDRNQALRGACEIIAEWIADNFDYRKNLREMLWRDGQVVSTVVPAKADQKTKYNMYYNRRESVARIPSHRVLAIRRGSKEGILTTSIQGDDGAALRFLTGSVIRDPESPFAATLEAAVRDSYFRILKSLIETEVRAMLKQRADREAIRVFRQNLENLLLCSPAGPLVVIGVEAGKGEECQLAVVDGSGKLVEEATISPLPPKSDLDGTRAVIRDLVARNGATAIALGSGTAARQVEEILRRILVEEKLEEVLVTGINDAGVSVYASSRAGREELPEASVATRAAVSIARRLKDPLAELVKIDPKLIGVGQYQHDVDQKELHRGLMQTIQSCVNRVGVDPNSADVTLLRYVAGLNDRMARKVIDYRNANGRFANRVSLQAIPGLGEFTWQQAIGFLRIPDSDHPLDATAIHPESYPMVEKIAAVAGVELPGLIGNKEILENLKLEELAAETGDLSGLQEIQQELLNPGRDPRKKFAVPKFRPDIKDLSDLQEGMTLEGVVTNVTNFGAFVDVGIQQDGLVHLSQMSNRFIRDPREAVQVGDVVQVKVISVEAETRRIGLSIKALLPAAPPRRRRRPIRRPTRPASDAPGAHPSAQMDAGSTADAAASERRAPRRPGGRPFRKRRPEVRPEPPRQPAEAAEQSSEPSPAPQEPEPPPQPEQSLEEKIAMLKSKFRGLG